ncbi:sensor histidine kinase [Chloroflexota bacterium]
MDLSVVTTLQIANILKHLPVRIINGLKLMITNYHFWITSAVIVTLTFFYSFWPWISWGNLREFALFELTNRIIGFLFIIPFMYAWVFFRWQTLPAIWLAIFIVITYRLFQIDLSRNGLLINTILLTIPLLMAILITSATHWYKNKIRKETENKIYMSQTIQAQEDERLRLAQELHDDTIQKLLAIANRTHRLLSDSSVQKSSNAVESASFVRDSILDVAEDLRRLSTELRPTVLDTFGLVKASMSIVENISSQGDTEVSFAASGKERTLSSVAEITIFRIIQEALSNIARHAEAKLATVSLKYSPSFVSLLIQDDGCGFLVPDTFGPFVLGRQLGLAGIGERVKLLDGSLTINSSIGNGTSIRIKVKC